MTLTFKVLQIVAVIQRLSSKANTQKPGMPASRCCSISTVSTRAGINPKPLHLPDVELNDPGETHATQQGPQALQPAGVIMGPKSELMDWLI